MPETRNREIEEVRITETGPEGIRFRQQIINHQLAEVGKLLGKDPNSTINETVSNWLGFPKDDFVGKSLEMTRGIAEAANNRIPDKFNTLAYPCFGTDLWAAKIFLDRQDSSRLVTFDENYFWLNSMDSSLQMMQFLPEYLKEKFTQGFQRHDHFIGLTGLLADLHLLSGKPKVISSIQIAGRFQNYYIDELEYSFPDGKKIRHLAFNQIHSTELEIQYPAIKIVKKFLSESLNKNFFILRKAAGHTPLNTAIFFPFITNESYLISDVNEKYVWPNLQFSDISKETFGEKMASLEKRLSKKGGKVYYPSFGYMNNHFSGVKLFKITAN